MSTRGHRRRPVDRSRYPYGRPGLRSVFVCAFCGHAHEGRDEMLLMPGVCGWCGDPEYASCAGFGDPGDWDA